MKYIRWILITVFLFVLPFAVQHGSAAPTLEAFTGQLSGEAPTPS